MTTTPEADLAEAGRILALAKEKALTADQIATQRHRDVSNAQRVYSQLHEEVHPPRHVEVETPPGMIHVGWYCKHELVDSAKRGWTYTPHREPEPYKNKRGWSESTSTASSLSWLSPDSLRADKAHTYCAYRQPLFIKEPTNGRGRADLRPVSAHPVEYPVPGRPPPVWRGQAGDPRHRVAELPGDAHWE